MRSLTFLIAAIGVIGLPLVILAFSLTGFFGGLITVLIILAIGLRFAGFLALFVVPAIALTLATSIIVIGILSIAFIGGTRYYQKKQVAEARTKATETLAAPKKIIWAKLREIKVPATQWSESYSTPSGLFKIMPVDGKVEVLFSNGAYYLLDPLEQIDMGRVSGEYRLRGVGKEVIAGIFTAKTI